MTKYFRRAWLFAFFAIAVMGTHVQADLDTSVHIGLGTGSLEDNAGVITIGDSGEDGDMWTGGDSFQYYYDSATWTGDFSAQVRVVSQSDDRAGRWGKVGIRASADPSITDSAFAMVQTHSGVDSARGGGDGDDPRLAGRYDTGVQDQMFESGMGDSPPRGIVPIWLRLDRTDGQYSSYWAADNGDGTHGEWLGMVGPPQPINTGDPVSIGIAYSAHNSFDPDEIHTVTVDNYSIVVPEPAGIAMLGLGMAALLGLVKRQRR